jgi:MscS family membrane protein
MGMETRIAVRSALAGLVLLSLSAALLPAQEVKPPDDRFRSPRATVRTLYTSVALARESPRRIATAADCLDRSGLPPKGHNAGLLARQLEAILRAKEIVTDLLPDDYSDETYTLLDLSKENLRLVLRRMPDGRYLFDRASVANIPAMWADVQKALLDKNREAAALSVSPAFASPRATFHTFYSGLRNGDMETVIRCLDLRDVPAVARYEVGCQLSHKLVQIIRRYKLVISQELPDTNYADPYVYFSEPAGVIEITRQYAGERKGEWLFSAATVRSIDHLYGLFEDKPCLPEVIELISGNTAPDWWRSTDLWLRAKLPAWAKSQLIASRQVHIEVYEALGYLFLLASVFAVYRLALALLARGVRAGLRLLGVELPREVLPEYLRASARLLCIAYLRWGVLLLSVDRVLLVGLLAVLNPALWLSLAWAVFRLIDLGGEVLESRLAKSRHRVVATQMLLPVGSLAVKIALFLGTLFHLMQLFSWEVGTVLTGLGIGGLAFALGAQDTLKNLFGSFTLIADRPFVVGESVKIGDRGEGVVEVVGLRSTRIRTADDAVLTVPNSDLTTMHITNFGQRRFSRYHAKVGVAYATPTARLLAFRDGIRAEILKQMHTCKDQFDVVIHDLGSSAVELRIAVAFAVTGGRLEAEARESLILAVLRLAEALRVELTSPGEEGAGLSLFTGPAEHAQSA